MKIRFAVGTNDIVLSSFFFVSSHRGCAYFGAKTLGGTLKVSFHKDGNSHIRFGPGEALGSLANHYMARWKRPGTPPVGTCHVASIFFPTDLLKGQLPAPSGNALHFLLEPAPPGSAVEVGLFYSREPAGVVEGKLEAIGTPLFYEPLSTGEIVFVVTRTDRFNPSDPFVRNLIEGREVPLPLPLWEDEEAARAAELDNSQTAMLVWNDPNKAGVLQIVQVSGPALGRSGVPTSYA